MRKNPDAGKDWRREEKGMTEGEMVWMAPPTQWTWVWASSVSWWRTGKPGVLQSMGSQRVGHGWVTELNWTEPSTCYRSMWMAPCHATQKERKANNNCKTSCLTVIGRLSTSNRTGYDVSPMGSSVWHSITYEVFLPKTFNHESNHPFPSDFLFTRSSVDRETNQISSQRSNDKSEMPKILCWTTESVCLTKSCMCAKTSSVMCDSLRPYGL